MADLVPDLTTTSLGAPLFRLGPLAQRAVLGASAVAVGVGALGLSLLDSSRVPESAQLVRPFVEAASAAPDFDSPPPTMDFEFSAPASFGGPATVSATAPSPGADLSRSPSPDEVLRAASSNGDGVMFNAEAGAPAPAAAPATTTPPTSASAPAPAPQARATVPEVTGVKTPVPTKVEVVVGTGGESIGATVGECIGLGESCGADGRSEPGIDINLEAPILGPVKIALP